MKPRIAIVGTGIAGMTAAHRLRNHADLTLFEADSRPGGARGYVRCEDPNGPLAIDTGFIVCNPDNYPTFMALLDELGVKTQPSAMFPLCVGLRLDWNGNPPAWAACLPIGGTSSLHVCG